jgi:hypothetical protein
MHTYTSWCTSKKIDLKNWKILQKYNSNWFFLLNASFCNVVEKTSYDHQTIYLSLYRLIWQKLVCSLQIIDRLISCRIQYMQFNFLVYFLIKVPYNIFWVKYCVHKTFTTVVWKKVKNGKWKLNRPQEKLDMKKL